MAVRRDISERFGVARRPGSDLGRKVSGDELGRILDATQSDRAQLKVSSAEAFQRELNRSTFTRDARGAVRELRADIRATLRRVPKTPAVGLGGWQAINVDEPAQVARLEADLDRAAAIGVRSYRAELNMNEA